MSITTANLSNAVVQNSIVMGGSSLTFKHPQLGERTENVIVIGRTESQDGEVSDQRYYISGMVARTAFEDQVAGVNQLPAFAGRSRSEMEQYLLKNAR